MKSWREIAIPHSDVLKGTFKQAEFAADITAVRTGKAPDIYKNASNFFERTYITEGMKLLLTQVAERISGKGGEPVIQLQTAFGGGKTHTMLAVWHLATRQCEISDMPGVASIVESAGLMELPKAAVAVIDGTAHSPGQPWKEGRTTIKTLWGELAWQLGKADGYSLLAEADSNGTSPGKAVLRQLLEKYAPCVILMDELVAYIRQFPDGGSLSGGSYDSNLSFVQSLTEAAKLVPNAVVLASLPESEVEAGSAKGVGALKALEKTFGRVQALWKPVAPQEAFEIVRRRLFEPIRNENDKLAVCRAFADTYRSEGAILPSETQEGEYYERLAQAYPIHPEFFERLYKDWTTIEGFQRTRGVLKLLAKVISRLWKANNTDMMIMPGSLPLADSEVRNEMTYLLPPGWDPVIDSDIDGERAETTSLEAREPRFGQVNAARRVARTLFLGSAPSSVATKPGIRGVDRGRVILGCLQPGQSGAVYGDALNRIADRLHYLNSSGDKNDSTTRYWFDTRANLRREMEDRKRRFDEKSDVCQKIQEVLKKLFNSSTFFDGVHVFTPHSDVPDDSALRLVLMPLDAYYLKENTQQSEDHVLEYLKKHGSQPRHKLNRLIFIAPDHGTLSRLKDNARTALAWATIVDDIDAGRLNLDQIQKKQAQKETLASNDVLPRVARECFKWLLCPVIDDSKVTTPRVESFPLNTTSGTIASELERCLLDNELIIVKWSPIHLRNTLQSLYWKEEKPAIEARVFWEDSLKYLYLPRLKSKEVLSEAIRAGTTGSDFFGTAYGSSNGKYDGFQFGKESVSYDESLLLIEPKAAKAYSEKLQPVIPPPVIVVPPVGIIGGGGGTSVKGAGGNGGGPSPTQTPFKSFRGSVDVNALLAKSRLNTLAEEIIALLTSDPHASVKVTVEIEADFPGGIKQDLKRGVSENANNLGFKSAEWE